MFSPSLNYCTYAISIGAYGAHHSKGNDMVFKYIISIIAEFNMTTTAIDSKMAALFDGNSSTCENIQSIVTKRSDFKVTKLNNVMGTILFDIMVPGLNSCPNYGFLFVLVENEQCDFVRSCNVTHDLATSHSSCIVSCTCEDDCDIVVMIPILITHVVGSMCEIMLLS